MGFTIYRKDSFGTERWHRCMELSKSDLSILSQSILFKDMETDSLLKAVSFHRGNVAFYKKGETLHTAFTPFSSFGLVLCGSVLVFSETYEGDRLIFKNVLPGETFGESLSFLKILDSPVFAQASKDCRILWLSPEGFFKDGEGEIQREMEKRFLSLLAQRTLAQNDRIQILSKLHLRDKILTYFTFLSQRAKSSTFLLPMDRSELAFYIGANRSAMERQLKALSDEGILKIEKNTVTLLKKVEI